MNTSPWQPISTAPRDGTRILCMNETSGVVHVCYPKVFSEVIWEFHRDDAAAPGHSWSMIPTHWMPIPPLDDAAFNHDSDSVTFLSIHSNPTLRRLDIRGQALREIVRRSEMLIHQNTGRWDMTVEHDARSHGVTEGNVRIARQALGEE